MRDGRSVFDLLAPRDLIPHWHRKPAPDAAAAPAPDAIDPVRSPLVVHVWTPEGSSKHEPVPRPVIHRYIAAADAKGVISTRHPALALPPATYTPPYPAAAIDRSPPDSSLPFTPPPAPHRTADPHLGHDPSTPPTTSS